MAKAFEIRAVPDGNSGWRDMVCLAPSALAPDIGPASALDGVALCAQTGKPVEAEAMAAMLMSAPTLDAIGADAAFAALDGILVAPHAGHAIASCARLLAGVIPELGDMEHCPQHSPYHIYDVLEHTAHVIDGCPATSIARWSALFHDMGKPRCRWTDKTGRDHFTGHAGVGAEIAYRALSRLDAPDRLRDDVCLLVERHEWFVTADEAGLQRALTAFDGRADLYRTLLALQIADSSAKAPAASQRLEHARALQSRFDAYIEMANGSSCIDA